MDQPTQSTNQKIKRFFYLLGQLPRIISLFKQLWSILMDTTDQELEERLKDLEESTKILKGATSVQKQNIAVSISDIIRRL